MCTSKETYQKKHSLVEIFEMYWESYYRDSAKGLYLEDKHFRAVNKMRSCRTGRMGIRKYECGSCGAAHYLYRSCKHRFCNQCGIVETQRWADQTLGHLLEMKHHHVVMTLPSGLRFLSKLNVDLLHSLLFRLSGSVLKEWFKREHGLECGIVSVLHTAGADLKYHPHVHMIVSGGGMGEEGMRELGGDYLCAQRSLANSLRRKFVKELLKLHEKGELVVSKGCADRQDFLKWLGSLKAQQWICSIQPPLSDVSQIVGYVGRYTKRACLSEYKLESIDGDQISFRFNDYKNTPRGSKPVEGLKEMDSVEFLDRLLQHVPEKGYRMVRYYGLYSSRKYREVPDEYKAQLGAEEPEPSSEDPTEDPWGEYGAYRQRQLRLTGKDPLYCKKCNQAYEFISLVYEKPNGEVVYADTS